MSLRGPCKTPPGGVTFAFPTRMGQIRVARLLLAWVVMFSWLSGAVARANVPVGAQTIDVDLRVTVVGSSAQLAETKAAISTERFRAVQFARAEAMSADAVLGAGADAAPTIRVWVDWSEAGKLYFYFAYFPAKRFLIRSMKADAHLDEIERDALSHILELSVSAMLEGETAGLSQEEVRPLLEQRSRPKPSKAEPKPKAAETAAAHPPSEPIERPPAAEGEVVESRVPWDVGVSYAASLHYDETLAHGPGLSVAVSPFAKAPIYFLAELHYRLPQTYTRSLAGVRESALSPRIGAEARFFLVGGKNAGPKLLGGGGLAFGANIGTISPESGDGGEPLSPEPQQTLLDFAVSVPAFLLLRLTDQAAVQLGLFVEMVPHPVRYDVLVDDELQTAFDAVPVRPGAFLAMRFGSFRSPN